MFWKKYSPSSAIDARMQVEVQTWKDKSVRIIPDASVTIDPDTILSGVLPQATSCNKHDIDSPVLSYGNVWIKDYDDATGDFAAIVAGKGLFETYYKKMFEMLKINPRIRTVFLNLKLSDIVKLDFRKLVYIDGVYYRINKILDYQPNKNTVTKVELICWKEFGAFATSAPAFGQSNSTNWGNGIYINTDDVAIPDDATIGF